MAERVRDWVLGEVVSVRNALNGELAFYALAQHVECYHAGRQFSGECGDKRLSRGLEQVMGGK